MLATACCTALAALCLLGLITLHAAHYQIHRSSFESVGVAFVVFAFATAALQRGPAPDAVRTAAGATTGVMWLPAIPALIAVGSFAWALALGPLSDDSVLLMWAHDGTWMPWQWGFVRPFPIALWRLALLMGAGWPALHAINVVCHAATAALLTFIGLRLFTSPVPALIAGVAFALFPASLEAVAWTSGVFDSVATCSMVAAAAIFLGSGRRWSQIAALAGLTMVALLSKETAVVLPALLVCLGFRGRLVALLTVSLGTVLYLVTRAALVEHAITSSLPEARWQLKDMLVRPFAAVSQPFHAIAPALLCPIAAVCLIVLIVAALPLYPRSTRPGSSYGPTAMAAGLAWVLLGALPLLVTFYIGPDLQGSRYAYLPMAGMAIAIGGAVDVAKTTRAYSVALAAVCGLFVTWIVAWPFHVMPWTSAARVRDETLARAQALITTRHCRSLELRHAPADVHGAYAFRVGVDVTLRALRYEAQGRPCSAAWQNGSIVLTGSTSPSNP